MMNKKLLVSLLIPMYLTTVASVAYASTNIIDSNNLINNVSTERIKVTNEDYKFNNVPKEYIDKEKESLKSKVIIENDIRLFTLFAFMNYTGYDDENRNEGFSEARQLLRDELKTMNISLADNKYYKNKNVEYSDYIQALKYMGGEPDFKYLNKIPDYLVKLTDLPQRLEEFYKKADIGALYKKYNSYYEKEMNKYGEDMYEALAKMNYYLKVDTSKIQKFYVCPNLLDAYWRGYGLGNIDCYKNAGTIVAGPSIEANIVLIVHEYIHGIITPITNSLEKEINRTSYKLAQIPSNTQAKTDYCRWQSIVDESIIRGIDHKVVKNYNSQRYLKDTMNHGFILANYFDDNFDEFQNYKGDLNSFIKMLIEKIN